MVTESKSPYASTGVLVKKKDKTTTSHEVHDSASDEAHHTLEDDDALILFGDDSLNDKHLESEDDINNDNHSLKLPHF